MNRKSLETPIPGSWYDADYFEHGIKSNWKDGYTWEHYSNLFYMLASALREWFPEAMSYLDIGCAKGFLIRTLRERGRDAWGFDHAPWALDHAEPIAVPYVTLASVDDVAYDRQFDMLLAFETFEHLTEDQLRGFLPRAVSWCGQGLLATLPTLPESVDPATYVPNDGDESHITLRHRSWWHALFLATGWTQDPLHRIAQRMIQNHRLTVHMVWQVYLYVPLR